MSSLISRFSPAFGREFLLLQFLNFLAFFPPGEDFWQPYFLRDIYRTSDYYDRV